MSLESEFGRQGRVFHTGTGVFSATADKATHWVHRDKLKHTVGVATYLGRGKGEERRKRIGGKGKGFNLYPQ